MSTPQVYDVDEEYVAMLLYSLASLQTQSMTSSVDSDEFHRFSYVTCSPSAPPLLNNHIVRCREIINNYLTYPSPSFKCKVLMAALYAESVFEMCARYPVTTLFSKYIDPSFPLYSFLSSLTGSKVRCEAYRCLIRVLLRKEDNTTCWVNSFSWIFNHALNDPDPSVPVAFLDYLINPETKSPFTPVAEYYLNTTRLMRPSLPNFSDSNNDGFMIAECIWKAMKEQSRYNTQLRKLLFILYKHLFGVELPKVYATIAKEVRVVKLVFDDTPLVLYPAMVFLEVRIDPR